MPEYKIKEQPVGGGLCMHEEWRDIEGYEGMYQISNAGRVKSFKYKSPRIMKPHYDKRGYGRLILRKDGRDVPNLVHRLVARAFISNPYDLPEVNHKDENPRNNLSTNLEWCDKKYNNNYGTKIARGVANRDSKAIGEKNSLTVLQYSLDGELLKEWESANVCKKELGYDNSAIAKCCRGNTKTSYGYVWKYKEEVESGIDVA